MKTTELQIGDWVKDKYKPKPHRVDNWADFNSSEDLSPIPLTPKILEKNGWNTPINDCGFSSQIEIHGGDTCVTIDAIHHRLDIRLDDINYDMPTPRYVHELQHALRLCGLNELADNFKI